jgi:nucleoside-diphosphate-sugar epimerase
VIGVTGGQGFVGSNINFADVKLSKDECPLDDLNKTIDCFSKYNFDTIIHCAAKQKNFKYMNKLMADHYYDNAIINLNLFKAAQKTNVKNIVTLSSINAIHPSTFYEEKNLWLGEPDNNCYTDGHKNRMLHILSKSYKSQYNINCISPMLSNTYGPFSKVDNGVIPILIDKCFKAQKDKTDFIIMGDGNAERDFIYIDDVVDIISWLIENYNSSKPVILSSGKRTTVKDIVEIVIDEVGFQGKVVWDTSMGIGQNSKLCSNKKLLSILSDYKFTDIEKGISKTVNQMRLNYV